jgi:16S rRNA G966 N2-methylase RsmD
MSEKIEKSWFTVDGSLSSIDFPGDSHVRFPEEVAERIILTYSQKGDWILDPFAGFGTTIHSAQKLERSAVGIELDAGRMAFANKDLTSPNVVINGRAQDIKTLEGKYTFNLVLTSPPYMPVRLEDDPWGKTYFDDMKSIFTDIKKLLAPNAFVVVEVSNIRRGGVRPLAWQLGELLSGIYEFQGEVIRCNTSETEAGPGFNHSYLLVYKSS